MKLFRFALAGGLLIAATSAIAQDRPQADAARIDTMMRAMFSRVSPEWQARARLDDTQRACTERRNQVSAAEADAIQARERATVVLPPDGNFLGDWRKGFQVANNGRGGQFSDPAGTVAGGNCFACHQMDPKEVSYGTLGPSLAAYGRDRNYDPELIRDAYIKIYNSQAAVACSNMPRFGAMKVLTIDQIKDVLAYLFDRQSPVNQ
ncbi:MAG: sulfur oxidation c-type cytochrome SoxX [Phreatobacter sp.]|uniref:sulfur oxidation c-type cytochrome SoxX n=1 Tax=Phreatobacter sp. TaxID=1966341 RepID=UPI001A5619AA|nr:sulfur oxidation c-type cytochrome SoxX [Phreatobacter sp.]MBL8571764.1 sulfur oxidation c-type cytochrome SoxX [Phreatobacter sp.]